MHEVRTHANDTWDDLTTHRVASRDQRRPRVSEVTSRTWRVPYLRGACWISDHQGCADCLERPGSEHSGTRCLECVDGRAKTEHQSGSEHRCIPTGCACAQTRLHTDRCGPIPKGSVGRPPGGAPGGPPRGARPPGARGAGPPGRGGPRPGGPPGGPQKGGPGTPRGGLKMGPLGGPYIYVFVPVGGIFGPPRGPRIEGPLGAPPGGAPGGPRVYIFEGI